MGRREARTISPINRLRKGFTLIELAFVTAVLVILLALALPKFQATAQRLRFEQSVMHLTQTLRAARERSIAEARMLLWVWQDEDHQSHLEALAENGQTEPVEERPGFRASLPATASVEITSEGRAVSCRCVRFYPDGTSDPTTTLTLRERQLQVFTITVHETTGSACLVAGTAAC